MRIFHVAARVALSMVFALLVLLEIAWVPLAYADDLAACVNQKVQFDGTVPLHYATVNDASGLRLYLNAGYSGHCSAGDAASCPKTAYIVPGDAVAIGKQCGTRDYVQYIGEKHISEGWVDASGLSPITPPAPSAPPVSKLGDQAFPAGAPRHYKFVLTQGKGLPVCEAYQQRLNQSDFYNPPYCGRPESTLVPGFATLQRRYQTVDEYKALYWDVMAVLNHAPPHSYYTPQKNPDGSTTLVPPSVSISADFTPAAWTYDPPVDLENSGKGGDVLVWTDEDKNFSRCGLDDTRTGAAVRSGPVGIIVSADGKNIDVAATYDLFAFQEHLERPPMEIPVVFVSGLGVFRYHGQDYFDTFFDWTVGDDAGNGRSDRSTNKKLGVFLSAHQQRQRICEYNVPDIVDSTRFRKH